MKKENYANVLMIIIIIKINLFVELQLIIFNLRLVSQSVTSVTLKNTQLPKYFGMKQKLRERTSHISVSHMTPVIVLKTCQFEETLVIPKK